MGVPGKHNDSLPLIYVLSCAGAAVAEAVTFPLDVTKTRLQVQGERQATSSSVGREIKPRGMLKTCFGIIVEEGIGSLYRGLSPAILRHMVYSGCRVTFYEIIRDNVFKRDKDGRYPLWKALPTGMISGALGQFLASPTDLVKIRMQMEGKRILDGLKPRYKGTGDAFRSILRTEGVRGLWKGWVPNCQRAAFVCLGDLTTYDAAKQVILRRTSLTDNALTHSLSSACAGLVSAIFGTPMDVLKTRMMNQPYKDGRGVLYKSTLDCLLKTVKGEGMFAMYKGFVAIWTRMAPWSLTFWVVYEEVRVLAGVGTF